MIWTYLNSCEGKHNGTQNVLCFIGGLSGSISEAYPNSPSNGAQNIPNALKHDVKLVPFVESHGKFFEVPCDNHPHGQHSSPSYDD